MYPIFCALLLKKVALLFCAGEARGLINKIQGLSRTAKKSRTFPGCGNPELSILL